MCSQPAEFVLEAGLAAFNCILGVVGCEVIVCGSATKDVGDPDLVPQDVVVAQAFVEDIASGSDEGVA
jgi:hypothetical protein